LLQSVVEAFTSADGVRAELVAVDNGSTDQTPEVLQRFAQGHPTLALRRVHEAAPGLARARNAGVRAASGDWLAFTDDDCRLTPNYLLELDRHRQASRALVLLGGRVDLGDPADAPVTIKTDLEPARLGAGDVPGGFIHGCNMAMPRALFQRLGPFDPRLGAGGPLKAGEDTDYILRAAEAGVEVRYVPEMAVQHFHGRRTSDAIARLNAQYEYGNGALLIKHARRHPMLLKTFFWNLKDIFAERRGRLPSLKPVKGLTRAEIAAENLKGALAMLVRPER
jgi:GT2 family glycosyltransferase